MALILVLDLPNVEPLRSRCLALGVRTSVKLPLLVEGRVVVDMFLGVRSLHELTFMIELHPRSIFIAELCHKKHVSPV